MRQLTPLGYLTYYVNALSYCNSTNLRKLAVEAGTDNFRLRAPFMLYVVFSENQDRLLKILQSKYYKKGKEAVLAARNKKNREVNEHIRNFDFYEYCVDFFSKYNKDNIVAELESSTNMLDNEEYGFEYNKCWSSYKCKRDFWKRDIRIARACREIVLEHQEKYGITNNQIYHDLALNAGNVNAWLNYNKQTIGRASALKIVDYCRKFELEVQ